MQRLIVLLLVALALLGCAAAPPRPKVDLPMLALAPAALGRELALQQRLQFAFGAQQRELEALLEVDAAEVRLAVQALGQTGVRLSWDGHTLQQQRAPWLPPQVRGERVLSDLQFVLWPAEAIRAALPAPWTLEVEGAGHGANAGLGAPGTRGERRLLRDGKVWLRAVDEGAGRHRLENHAEGYRLLIESAGNGGAS